MLPRLAWAPLRPHARSAPRRIAAGCRSKLVRNGSRGLLWLEPLVEVDVAGTRMAYGPVQAEDVAGLFDAGFLGGKPHSLSLGPTAEIPYFKKQERLTFARVGLTDPRSLSDYLAHGGYRGLAAALAHGARGHRGKRHRLRSARPRRRGLSGRNQVEDRARCAPPPRNTWCAMRMRATQVPSPIAC